LLKVLEVKPPGSGHGVKASPHSVTVCEALPVLVQSTVSPALIVVSQLPPAKLELQNQLSPMATGTVA
jgi:hypothetical protein